jgi:cysteine synthase A
VDINEDLSFFVLYLLLLLLLPLRYYSNSYSHEKIISKFLLKISQHTGYLKEQNSTIQCYLADPHGSALYDYVLARKDTNINHKKVMVGGELVTFIPRDNGNSITEGIGIDRVTKNFQSAYNMIDGCFKINDRDAIEMAYFLKENEGVFVGPSAALNVVAAVKLAQKMGKGNTIVTVLCDGGGRYKSKLYTKGWLNEKGFQLMESEERNKLKWLQ